jgi:hypothetical protein
MESSQKDFGKNSRSCPVASHGARNEPAIWWSMQGSNLMTQRTVPTVWCRHQTIAPNEPATGSVYARETQERPRSHEFFPFDAGYVRRLTEGDAETERHFVCYFSPLLLIKLKQRLRSREQLEDLRQEVFLRVFRSAVARAQLFELAVALVSRRLLVVQSIWPDVDPRGIS